MFLINNTLFLPAPIFRNYTPWVMVVRYTNEASRKMALLLIFYIVQQRWLLSFIIGTYFVFINKAIENAVYGKILFLLNLKVSEHSVSSLITLISHWLHFQASSIDLVAITNSCYIGKRSVIGKRSDLWGGGCRMGLVLTFFINNVSSPVSQA